VLIVVHYGNGRTYEMTDNTWKRVPNKQDIVTVEVVRELDGRRFRMEKPSGTSVQFFSQRIGYSHISPSRALALKMARAAPIIEEQIGMIFNKDHVELLEVGKLERRYSTTFEKMGFSNLSLSMLGLEPC